jgi:quinol monooxygenase YgiN
MKERNNMVLATVRMKVPPKKHHEALRFFSSTAEWNRVKPGCLSSRVYKDAQEDSVIVFEEMWKTEEDLESYLRSDEYQKVLIVLEMALKQPEIRFDTISSSAGIETVERARCRTK